jgi:hypothetical protein
MSSQRYTALAVAALSLASMATAADRRQTYAELAAASDRVLIGTVGNRASHWGDDAHIYTDLVIYPDLSLKGEDGGPVVVQLLGGSVGDVTMTVSDGPDLPEGEPVVVFLKREGARFAVVGRSAGAIRAKSADAAAAVESGISAAERTVGARLESRRLAAASVLDRAAAGSTTAHAATQTGCYATDGAKWDVNSATYKIGSTIPAEWTAAIDAAAGTWNTANASFRLVNDANSVNELSYKDLVAAYGSSYSDTFAVTTTWSSNSTGVITKATTEVNNKWPWSTSGDANGADVQDIVTHELGHWMRLLDIYSPANCADVTMWGSAGYGETKKRTLEQPDVDGVLSLYRGGTATSPTLTAPALTLPAYRAMDVSTTPTLAWNASATATSYDVYFGLDSGQPLVATVKGTTYQPGPLTPGATYYWRVVAKNATASASSPTSAFTVSGTPPPAPSTLTLLTPTDGATGVSTRPLLSWTAVDGATSYDLYVGASSNPSRIGSVGGTSVNVSGFRSNTLYHWKVVARTRSGSVSSAVQSFRTN